MIPAYTKTDEHTFLLLVDTAEYKKGDVVSHDSSCVFDAGEQILGDAWIYRIDEQGFCYKASMSTHDEPVLQWLR